MKKVIGIVGEGPTDYLVIKEVIDHISGEENTYIRLQPEPNLEGKFGNGWKGVWKWCEDTSGILEQMFCDIIPKMDMLVIQMDADVSRKEKEVHCLCEHNKCDNKAEVHPLECDKIGKKECPVVLPCESHTPSPDGYVGHLHAMILKWLGLEEEQENILIVIPCDSTDAWIVAAYEEFEDVETIEEPWNTIIAKKKEYHEIRVPGKKKNVSVYSKFVLQLINNWGAVRDKCQSAKNFEDDIRKALHIS
ncbi:hypothetical protein [Ruminococcus sp. 5_1_39BFAA]|uniref:hypothetical protein n=1 Tax=Ruminococcus sp. 5_1_39BFAA TaxID=457412 RepID=UPI003563ED92